jgi:hypothetical protein
MFPRDFGQRHLLGHAGVGHDHVHLALRAPDDVGDAVEILKLGRVRLYRGDVSANELRGLVERLPAPSEDEHVRAVHYEPLGYRELDAAVSAADNADFAFQSGHNNSFGPGSRLVRAISNLVCARQAFSAEVRTSVVRNRSI